MTIATIARRALLAGLASPALAQPRWAPSRPIRIIVPFPPGQAVDIFARIIGEKAAELHWPQHRVVVDNRAGAGGTIGMQAAAQSAPDGHTIVFGSLAALAINPAIMRSLPYDAERDFAPILRVFEGALVCAVPVQSPIADLGQLVQRARAGTLTYASSGPGSTQHMATELFLQGIEARATHVPYRGSGPALTDLAAGAVDFAFESTAATIPLLRGGRLRALAVTSTARRSDVEAPTVAEAAGLPGYSAYGSGGLLAPANTPQPVLDALHEGLAAAMADAGVRQRMEATGTAPLSEGPAAFAAFLRAERAKWREVARRGAIVLE